MAKGARKGSEFERKICRQLSLWWTDGERDDVFWRTSQSGGRATTRAAKGQRTYGQHGDIAATDPIGEPLLKFFLFELKTGYPALANIVDWNKCQVQEGIVQWARKAREQSTASGAREWLLIYRPKHRSPLVFAPIRLPPPAIRVGPYYVMLFSELLKTLKPIDVHTWLAST